MDRRPTVAVIGAGFSGVMTALNLLNDADGPRVRLIERRARFGLGAAYQTTNPDHLLNVRAANMSAYPDQPHHFLTWLGAQGQRAAAHTFVSRAIYGAYLQSLLKTAAEGPRAAGRLILEGDEATAVRRDGAGWALSMAVGRVHKVDALVLALGNLAPHGPPALSPDALASPRYVADPWAWSAEEAPGTGTAVLLGSGLTMVDVALTLAARKPDLKLVALSRRGLLPRRHMETGPAPAEQSPDIRTFRNLLRHVRSQSAVRDWRCVIDGLRPYVQSVWRNWPEAERQRFLRHGRIWWDIHRHRLAPSVASQLDHLAGSGRLRTLAGRLQDCAEVGEDLLLRYAPRGRTLVSEIKADLVVNCTGPNGDLAKSKDAILASLLVQGLIRPDACRLGVEVDSASRLLDHKGDVNPRLFAVGPITRGAFWEITSVPDIRLQARDCAASVISALTDAPAPVS
jgi:uncharacterized NAD(P)/FAD-binding protein YdhS